ncbi:MAG: DUF3306 domain-containing protein [Caldimonas sp.]
MAGSDGFLSRWARRKADARSGDAATEPIDLPAQPSTATASMPAVPTGGAVAMPPAPPTPDADTSAPLPTLDDVARLTHASDFSPYVARNVDAGVRNAAMKKLFSDPRFNIMDGLDTYIDDYGKPDPIPLSMLRRMNQSIALGLFADEDDPAVAKDTPAATSAKACPDGGDPVPMAKSPLPDVPLPAIEPRSHDDPDLQLQPDDADRRAGAGPSARD